MVISQSRNEQSGGDYARTETVIITNMCMVYNNGKVLVQDRVDSNWKGITFPGGHVDKGESFTDAVIREVFEETGLTISAPQLCGIKDWPEEDGSRYIVLFYKTDKFVGELRSSDEGADVRIFVAGKVCQQKIKIVFETEKGTFSFPMLLAVPMNVKKPPVDE